jgi:hypothetical protein
LLVYDSHGEIDVFAPDGSSLYSLSAQVPGAKVVNIQNAAADTDGTVAGVDYSRDGSTRTAGGGIALFDQSGRQMRFFDTGQYLPTQVCFTPDHSIWALGWLGDQVRHNTDDYFVMRNYSQDGQEIGAFLLRSLLESEVDPIGPAVGLGQLRITNDRIGAVFLASSILKPWQSTRPLEWIEVDLKGKVLGHWGVGAEWLPRAFTRSGALYTQSGNEVLMLDRSTKAWRQVAGTPAGSLLGADGDDLVFEVSDTNKLRWVPATQ